MIPVLGAVVMYLCVRVINRHSLLLIYKSFRSFADLISHSGNQTLRLNFENVRDLDNLIVNGYQHWVDRAPDHWKVDGFITENSPIVVTSCFGQNAAIALPDNEVNEAALWDADRDYSKIAFLTVAIATSIQWALRSFFLSCSNPHSHPLKMHRDSQLGFCRRRHLDPK